MEYVMIQWLDKRKKQSSVCKRSSIADEALLKLGSALVGKTVPILFRHKLYMGKVMKIGNKQELDREVNSLDYQKQLQLHSSREQADNQICSTKSSKTVLETIDSTETGTSDETTADIFKDKYKTLKRKYRELKQLYKETAEKQISEETIELVEGSGILMKKTDYNQMKLLTNRLEVSYRNVAEDKSGGLHDDSVSSSDPLRATKEARTIREAAIII